MTRPMPGPPDPMPHEDSARPHDSAAAPWNYCSGCAAENRLRLADPKRLTDAECAAEYWRALREDEWDDYLLDDGYGPPNIDPWGKEWWPRSGIANEDRLNTWRRFARTPHALEES